MMYSQELGQGQQDAVAHQRQEGGHEGGVEAS
jgi:hypothetical protein